MIKKVIRIILIFTAFTAALLVLISAGFNMFFSQKRLKWMFINGIRGYVQRDAKLEHISFKPFSGLTVRGLSISEHPDFKRGTFLTVKELGIRGGILQFVQHRISKIDIDAPDITIALKRAGSSEYPLFADHKKLALKERASRALLFITGINVRQGRISFTHALVRKELARIEELSISCDSVFIPKSFPLSLSFKVIRGVEEFDVVCKGTIDIPNQEIEVREAIIHSLNGKLMLSGSLKGFIDTETISYDAVCEGDREVLDGIIKLFSDNDYIQFLDTPNIRVSLRGDKNGIKVSRK